MPIVPGASVSREQEIGLVLPDGTKLFPPETWHGVPLVTSVDREMIVATLRKAGANMGFADLLDHYRWISRDKITATVYELGDEFPITMTGDTSNFTFVTTPVDGVGEPVSPEALENGSSVD